MDVKHIIGAVIGAALALGIKYAASQGVDVPCPVNPPAVAAAQAGK